MATPSPVNVLCPRRASVVKRPRGRSSEASMNRLSGFWREAEATLSLPHPLSASSSLLAITDGRLLGLPAFARVVPAHERRVAACANALTPTRGGQVGRVSGGNPASLAAGGAGAPHASRFGARQRHGRLQRRLRRQPSRAGSRTGREADRGGGRQRRRGEVRVATQVFASTSERQSCFGR